MLVTLDALVTECVGDIGCTMTLGMLVTLVSLAALASTVALVGPHPPAL